MDLNYHEVISKACGVTASMPMGVYRCNVPCKRNPSISTLHVTLQDACLRQTAATAHERHKADTGIYLSHHQQELLLQIDDTSAPTKVLHAVHVCKPSARNTTAARAACAAVAHDSTEKAGSLSLGKHSSRLCHV